MTFFFTKFQPNGPVHMFCTHVAILATFLIFLICILLHKMAHDQFDSFEVEKHWSLESGSHSSSLTGIEVSHSK